MLAITEETLSNSRFMFASEQNRLVSPANKIHFTMLHTLHRSLTYNMNNFVGQCTELWDRGMLSSTWAVVSDIDDSILNPLVLARRKTGFPNVSLSRCHSMDMCLRNFELVR